MFFTLLCLTLGVSLASTNPGNDIFTNSFLVELKGNYGKPIADEVAKRNGFNNVGPVSI